MRVYGPDFFRDFRCTGSECSDNCCRMGWDIEIDDDTYNYYKSLDCGLCEHISDENGEHYIIQRSGQCPFLNENGLCSIVLRYGEQHISEICTHHPRFYQWFGNYKEAGTGLCCERSAMLWLTHAGDIRFCDWETDEQPDDLDFDPALLNAVLEARKTLISLMQSDRFTLSDKLALLLIFGLNAQDLDDTAQADGFLQLSAAFSDTRQLSELLSRARSDLHPHDRLDACKQILEYMSELEYMKPDFPGVISQINERLDELVSSGAEFSKAVPQADDRLCAVAVYYLFRYFIDCARSQQCLPVMVFTILSVWFTRLWSIMQFNDGVYSLEENIISVKEFSKEIEYSDNTDRIYEDIYTDSRLSARNILNASEV